MKGLNALFTLRLSISLHNKRAILIRIINEFFFYQKRNTYTYLIIYFNYDGSIIYISVWSWYAEWIKPSKVTRELH